MTAPENEMSQETKPSFITVQHSITGWMAVHVWWNPDMGGFYEPWTTGFGKYSTREEAIEEAKTWAESEQLECQV